MLKFILPAIFTISFFNTINSQDLQLKLCGTELHNANTEHLKELDYDWKNFRRFNKLRADTRAYSGSTIFVPIQLYIIRNTDGTGGISESEAIDAIDRMNKYYIDADIHFFQCNTFEYIDNDEYADYDNSEMSDLYNDHHVENVLNLYVADNVSSGSTPICGHAQFPGGLDFAIQATSCMINGSTLIHEVGHYFGLYHTHETFYGSESVDGSDCLDDGDLLCDTPADPRLGSGNVQSNNSCIYTGSEQDENGDSYSPQTYNIMSYTPKDCRTEFTEDQHARILFTLNNERTYLSCSTPTLEAQFYVSPAVPGSENTTFTFMNISEGEPDSYSWDFGDSNTSTSESPSHTFNESGVFTVELTVTKAGNTSTYSQVIQAGKTTVPYENEFESGNITLDSMKVNNSMRNIIEIINGQGVDNTNALVFHGTQDSQSSPYFQTPSGNAFDERMNQYYKSSIEYTVDGRGFLSLQVKYNIRQLREYNLNYTNFRITVNDNELISYTPDSEDTGYTSDSLDLSAYDNSVFTLRLEGSHKYSKDVEGINQGNATFIDNLRITGDSDPLPVDFLSFDAELENNFSANNHVKLKWTTTNEYNNDYFSLERSVDGNNWKSIYTVAGDNNINAINSYGYMDYNYLPQNSYYRIAQIDKDGSVSYSVIRSVFTGKLKNVEISPNPTSEKLYITGINSQENINLYDLRGSEVKNFKIYKSEGSEFVMDVENLNSGVYFLRTPEGLLNLLKSNLSINWQNSTGVHLPKKGKG